MSDPHQALCWINGEIVQKTEARISVFDHGLLYGDGVFEGIRFYNGQAFRLQPHLQRLYRSATALALRIPYSEEELTHAVNNVIAGFGNPHGYLRLVVTRGEGLLGLDPTSCSRPNIILIADHIALVNEEQRRQGVRAVIAATRRLPPDGLDARIKSLNYLNHILARLEASNAGAQEAILLNASGHVAEGTADNVFIVRDDMLYTPRPTDGALEGVTRGIILKLAAQAGIHALEQPLAPYDLYTADECFLTGTGAELIPVREINGRPLKTCPGPVFTMLLKAFEELVRRETLEGNL